MNTTYRVCQNCKMVEKECWIKIHLEQRMPIVEIAKISGYHPDTLYIWKARYLEYGLIGLRDQSRRPHGHPHQYPEHVKEAIKEIRARALEKEKRYLGPKIVKLRLDQRYDIQVSASGIGKKDERRLFSEEQKRLLWHTNVDKKCGICGDAIKSWDDLQIDHKDPWSLKGPAELENGQMAHATCNRKKSKLKIHR